MQTFSQWFAKLREARRLTQTEAAEQLGLSGPTISRWEAGAALPRVEHLKALRKWAKVSASKLLSLFE